MIDDRNVMEFLDALHRTERKHTAQADRDSAFLEYVDNTLQDVENESPIDDLREIEAHLPKVDQMQSKAQDIKWLKRHSKMGIDADSYKFINICGPPTPPEDLHV